jgi:hypothetical protein
MKKNKFILIPIDIVINKNFNIYYLEFYIKKGNSFKCVKKIGEKLTPEIIDKILKYKNENKNKILVKVDDDTKIFEFFENSISNLLNRKKDMKKILHETYQILETICKWSVFS